MKTIHITPTHKSERGQSLVELAVVIVIMLILLAGVIDLGRVVFEYMTMADAAQEGAVYASMYPVYCDQAVDRVYSNLSNPDRTEVSVTININGTECASASASDACAGNDVYVLVSQPNYELVMPFIGAILGRQSISLRADVTSTILRPACGP